MWANLLCVCCFSQTGSGKTHTMLGDIDNLDKLPSENRGMIPRVFEYLFARIRKVSISKMKFLSPKLKLCKFLGVPKSRGMGLLVIIVSSLWVSGICQVC